MPDFINLPALKVLYLTATPEKQLTIRNNTTGATISYGATEAVGDGTIAAAASFSTSDAIWVRSDINAQAILTYKTGTTQEDLTLADLRRHSPKFTRSALARLDVHTAVAAKRLPGGTSPSNIQRQIRALLG